MIYLSFPLRMKTRYFFIAIVGICVSAGKCVDDVADNFPILLDLDRSFTINSSTATGSETLVIDLSAEKVYQDNKDRLSSIKISEIRLSATSVPDPTVVCNYVLIEATDQGQTFAVTDTLRNVALSGLTNRVMPGTQAQLNKLGALLKNSTTPLEVYYRYRFNKPATGTVLNTEFKLKLKLS